MPAPQLLLDLATPWAALYSASQPVSVAVTFVHFTGLVLAGGSAVAIDRDTLRTSAYDPLARTRIQLTIRGIHRWVLTGLALTLCSGLLLLASDLETYWGAPVFWVKMGLVALLLANGALLRGAEQRTAPDDIGRWRWLQVSAGVSLGLWFAILLASILVTTAA